MRPLPDLSPLPPPGSIFDPAADDFTQLLSDQPQTFDQLQALLNAPADQALADIDLLSTAIDDLGTFSDAIDRTFSQIDVETQQVDYTQTIGVILALEGDFYSALANENPNAQPAIDAILNYILGLLVKLVQWIIELFTNLVYYLIGYFQTLIENSNFNTPFPAWGAPTF